GAIVQAYLDTVQAGVNKQIEGVGHKRPECYKRRTFWIHPPDDWFAFESDPDVVLGPERLYYPAVFVWIPTRLLPLDFTIKCVFCGKGTMTDSGWNSNPVARRVVGLDSCYYILSKRVKCRHECGKSCSMYNVDVLKQLPERLRNRFPAFFTHRSGFDKDVMTLVRSTIAQGMTPNAWERVLRELHVRKRDLAERAYLQALKAFPADKLPTPLKPFSPFADKDGYAGFSPSRWYISQVYVEYMAFIKPHHDQAMAAVTLSAASMDQSFKAIKYIARLNGVKVFGSLWTIINEFEQIRQMVLTPTRHLTHIEKPLRGIVKSLHEHGHPPLSLLWTDNVKADHQFVERVIPTLRVNVDPTTSDGGKKYPALTVPNDLRIRVASSISLIDQTCRSILADLEQQETDQKIFVGFSVDWDWQAGKEGHFPAALMQISVADFVYLLQTYHISTPKLVPTSLKALLLSPRVIKVGHHVQGTLDNLSFLWEFKICDRDKASWIDLGILARSKGLIPQASMSLKRLSEEVLGRTFDGLEDARCSDWCRESLSNDQKTYVVRNVWLSLHLFKAIVEKPPAGARLSRIGLPGENITMRNGTVTVAQGFFGVQMTKFPVSDTKTITLSNSKRALVTITKVVAPSFICHYHGKTLGEMGEPPFDVVVDLPSLVSREIEREETPVQPEQDLDDLSVGDEDQSRVEPDSESDSERDSAYGSDDESDVSPVSSTTQENPAALDHGEDEYEEFMDPDLDAAIALHPEGPAPSTTGSVHPLVQPAHSDGPWPTRTFQDVLHEMERLNKHINKDHSLAKQFSRWLRDAILVPDKIDKARVEAVLKKRGKTWAKTVRNNPDWVWQRVRRFIPPPDILEAVLKKLFATHANLPCSKNNIRLFNEDCRKAAAAMLDDVRKGWVSDPPGIALFNRLRTDEAGLPIWHCIRGTSSLEGGVHMPVRSRFGSLGASVEMSVAHLSDFSYRKNIESGSRHRDGIEYDGHYDHWIEDEIDILFQSLPFDEPRQSRPGYINLSLFRPTQESFFISEFPQQLREKYNIPPHEKPPRVETTEISALPLVKLSGARTNHYEFLAAAQNTKFALVPIHTDEEYALFNKAVRPGGQFSTPNGPPNFVQLTQWWSSRVNGNTIFFKLPEYLQAHYKTWNAARDEMTTMHMTSEARKEFSDLISSEAHTSLVLDESYSPVVQTRNAISAAASTSVAARDASVRRVAAVEALSKESKLGSPSTSPITQRPSMAFVEPGPVHPPPPVPAFSTPDSHNGLFRVGSGTTSTISAVASSITAANVRKPAKKKSCVVCRSVGRPDSEASECRGRGNRELCRWYGTEGAVGKKR
ncbi:hypothetical protein C8R46DRAFT_912792, partial [Mycena filopes]